MQLVAAKIVGYWGISLNDWLLSVNLKNGFAVCFNSTHTECIKNCKWHKSIFTRNQWILFPTLTRIFTPLSAKSNDRLLKAFAARVNCKLSSEMLPPTCRAHLAPRARQRIATVLLCFDCSRAAAQRQYGGTSGGALDKEETLVARALFDNGAMDFPWFALDKHHIL